MKARFKERLPVCDLKEATMMLDRFLDPEALQYARTNPHPEVRSLALKYLHEFEAEGDPYSRDILSAGGWEIRVHFTPLLSCVSALAVLDQGVAKDHSHRLLR